MICALGRFAGQRERMRGETFGGFEGRQQFLEFFLGRVPLFRQFLLRLTQVVRRQGYIGSVVHLFGEAEDQRAILVRSWAAFYLFLT